MTGIMTQERKINQLPENAHWRTPSNAIKPKNSSLFSLHQQPHLGLRFRRRRWRHLRIIINIHNKLTRLQPGTEIIDLLNLFLFLLFDNTSNLAAAAALHALAPAAGIATAAAPPGIVRVAGPDVRALERTPLALGKHDARTGRRGLAERCAALARGQRRDGTDFRRALPDEANVGREGGRRGRRREHFDTVVWTLVFLGGAADGRYAG